MYDCTPMVTCPRCGQTVHRVDGEYQRHYKKKAKKKLCVMSCREVR